MEMLARMQEKMDKGFKITNFSCTFCTGVTMMKNIDFQVYCPKCNKEYRPSLDLQDNEDQYLETFIQKSQPLPRVAVTQPKQVQEQPDEIEKSYEDFLKMYNSSVKSPMQIKSQKASKKMGELLISGWAMLEDYCEDCNVPLMKSKKNNLLCCGCDKDYSVSKNQQSQNVPQQIVKTKKGVSQKPFQAKEQKIAKKLVEHQKQKPKQRQQQKQEREGNVNNSEVCQKLQNISCKTLDFIDKRLDAAIEANDLESVERLIKVAKSIKQLV